MRRVTRGAGDRWLAGDAVPGVSFALHDAVRVTGGEHDGARGTIALLIALSPEPSYLVAVAGRGDLRVRQRQLRADD